jgi:[acyl-carrier-protein] S-malonyltransferase
MLLPVSAPFHSSLLRPAAERLAAYLADVAVQEPQIPVINNVDVASVLEPAGIRDALARQACRPVRWVEVIHAMAAAGADRVIECGPGKVLAGLTKRIVPSLDSAALSDAAAFSEALGKVQAG